MTFVSLGDLARTMIATNQSKALRTDIQTLTQALASGQKPDVANTDARHIASLDARLTRIDALTTSLTETAGFLSAAQMQLGRISDRVGDLGRDVVSLGTSAPGSSINRMADAARQSLADVVSALNATHSGRALFAGVATTGIALATPESLLAAAKDAIGNATTPGGAMDRLNTWLDDPIGFAASHYLGSPKTLSDLDLGDGSRVSYTLRANDPTFRDVLRDTLAVALAPDLALSPHDQSKLQVMAGQSLLSTQSRLVSLQESLGHSEERVSQTQSRMQSERSALQSARLDLTAADPFETAVALQDIQLRLETFYAVTARNAQLSLAAFLR